MPGQLPPSKNDRSLVARVTTATGSVLALGDLESRGLSAMLEKESLASAMATDILIAPHHGAHNRALLDLLLHITPDEVWISARAGFPNEGTMLLFFQSGLRYRGTWGNSPIVRR